jgi:hypothetical protein
VSERTDLARKAILAGDVTVAPGVAGCIGRLDLIDPDWSFTKVTLACAWGKFDGNGGGFSIEWETQSAGRGRADFYLDGGRLRCMNEGMGRAFLKQLLGAVVDQCDLDMVSPR